MKIRSAGWFRDKATFRSEELRETAIRLRKRTREELIENRELTRRHHLYTMSHQTMKVVNRAEIDGVKISRWWWMLYPHSSDRQRARYARQNKLAIQDNFLFEIHYEPLIGPNRTV